MSLRYSLPTSASKPPAITARSVIDDGYPIPVSILASIPYRAELLAARKHDCILASGVRLKTLLKSGFGWSVSSPDIPHRFDVLVTLFTPSDPSIPVITRE